MKIKLSFVVIFFATLFFACNNEGSDASENSTTDVSLSKINSVIMEKDYSEQKVEYSLLNQKEKFIIWNRKMSTLLNSSNLNETQKQLVQELQDNIKPVFFDKKSNDEKEYFKNIFVKNFLLKIDKNFNRKQINNLFYSVTNNETSADLSETAASIPAMNCNCNLGSLFGCGTISSCKKVICTNLIEANCGFLWAWDCDGGCIL